MRNFHKSIARTKKTGSVSIQTIVLYSVKEKAIEKC